MPVTLIRDVRLYWELKGDRGDPMVLVHGSWGDHHNWDAVVPGLTKTWRVLTYDRRGHSQSERVATPGSIEEDAADLAALIQNQWSTPAHIIGNSFGAIVVLKLAATRPELFATMMVHEPPLIGMLPGDPILAGVRQRIGHVLNTLRSGNTALGAEEFVNTIALGPGMWDKLTPAMRATFLFNAPTWMDEMNQPESAFVPDLERLATFDRPALISQGDQSPPFLGVIVGRIASTLTRAHQLTFKGAGHVPHVTHPEEYIRAVSRFINGAT